MHLGEIITFTMRLGGIFIVTLSLLFYMLGPMMAIDFDPSWSLSIFAVTVLLAVSLVMIATRAGFVAAAALIAATIFVGVSFYTKLDGWNPAAIPIALGASLAPLIGLAMISYAARRARSTRSLPRTRSPQ
jgi:hypothetical protein